MKLCLSFFRLPGDERPGAERDPASSSEPQTREQGQPATHQLTAAAQAAPHKDSRPARLSPPRLQNSEQVNSRCFKPLSCRVVCYKAAHDEDTTVGHSRSRQGASFSSDRWVSRTERSLSVCHRSVDSSLKPLPFWNY